MWVFILLLLIGSTIIATRVFRNGAREEAAEPAERRTFTPASPPTVVGTRQSAASGQQSAVRTQRPAAATASPYPPATAENAGVACPSCGTDTVPGAKFCGECGHRLVN